MYENKPKIIGNIIVALILSLAAIISVYIGVYGLAEYKSKKNSIDIRGCAVQQITSDLIVWTGYFDVQALDMKDGYNRLEADREKVKNYLVGKGFKEEELIFSAISTDEKYVLNEYGSDTNKIANYDLSQTVTISSNEIDKVTEVSRNATELLNEDVQFESYAPEYHYTKLADLKVTMLAEATKDATQRAKMIAENAGSKLGGLKHAHISDIQISPLYSDGIDYYDEYGYYLSNDIISLEKEVTVVVYCTFEIK
ncbi:MAG TPA: SIMPL domain-containing protein [Mobilitalea sp.]|nr:SIMPL domain-containing protein [Mobilitalea sp.]